MWNMRAFNPHLAEIRFGYGLSPLVPPPRHVDDLLAGLTAPDFMQARYPIEDFSTFRARMAEAQQANRTRRKMAGTPEGEAARKKRNVLNKHARQDGVRWMVNTFLRAAHTPTAFRERITAFWANHFTARGKFSVMRRATGPYIEEAIRPNINGRFEDLLIAAVTHPLMVHYLDQEHAIGPNSPTAVKRNRDVGLNENLAREVLELHTLGVDGPYTQTDVRQLAELFTGLTFDARKGRKFRKDWAEPGAETVLGRTYSERPRMDTITDVLRDLARHPATAQHVARKLAQHFVLDTPPAELVEHLATRFRDSGGDLKTLYAALLHHPASWTPALVNAKPPADFVASTFRALDVTEAAFEGVKENRLRDAFVTPLNMMGQPWQQPPGPDGWPEDDSAWVTPQGLAWRVQWAMAVPVRMLESLPDPREFVETALGPFATETVRFAAASAESQREAIGLVLMSPAFQRR